jgi:hypothetical protein
MSDQLGPLRMPNMLALGGLYPYSVTLMLVPVPGGVSARVNIEGRPMRTLEHLE